MHKITAKQFTMLKNLDTVQVKISHHITDT